MFVHSNLGLPITVHLRKQNGIRLNKSPGNNSHVVPFDRKLFIGSLQRNRLFSSSYVFNLTSNSALINQLVAFMPSRKTHHIIPAVRCSCSLLSRDYMDWQVRRVRTNSCSTNEEKAMSKLLLWRNTIHQLFTRLARALALSRGTGVPNAVWLKTSSLLLHSVRSLSFIRTVIRDWIDHW